MENIIEKSDSIEYSVLMAVYEKDNPEWFSYAIDSMLNQTITPKEFVIIGDGPLTPQLNRVIEEKSSEQKGIIRFIPLPQNRGLGEALRVGVEACSNEWIVRMDADDYSAPNRCEVQFAAQNETGADMIGCDINEFIGTPDNIVAQRVFPEKHDDIIRFGKRRTPFSHPGIIMRKSQILQAGNYHSAYLHEDYDLFVRMLMNGCIGYNVKQPLVSMRVSNDFYARRGGHKYLKALIGFNKHLYKIGWMGASDFIIRSTANTITCLMPNRFRDLIYKKVLRK